MTFLTSRRPTWLVAAVGASLVLVTGCAADGDDEPRVASTGDEAVGAGPGDEDAGQGSASPGESAEARPSDEVGGQGGVDPDPGSDGPAGTDGSDGICDFELVLDGVTTTAPDAATVAPDARILYTLDGEGALKRVDLFGGKNMRIGHVGGVARGFSNPRGSDPVTGVGSFQMGEASFDLRGLGGRDYAALPGTFDAEITAFDPPAALAGVVTGELSVSQERFPFSLSFEVTDAIEFPSGFLGC